MSDQIINKLGFDVTEALAALDRLDAKLKTVGNTLKQFASAADSVKRFSTASKHLDDTRQAAERLTVSWGYLTSRILYTQTVVSAFGKLRRTMGEAAESAVDYQRKIAEITTISDLSQAGASGIVRNLADQFNTPLLEEAAGLYQTLSNGITSTAEATQFLAEANKFAKATNSTTANSVDLLSAAIKGFGLSTEDTGKAAGVLFEAIRAGRITASELGPTFGRVGPRAAQLGLSLEETAGALAAITVRGVKTSEAITQLSGILTALTKPTEVMSENLRKLGFSSGEAAVATLTLPGLLQALANSTDGTSESMAKMFPNVRGIAGQLALTGKGLKEFATDVDAMNKAGANLAGAKYLQATATDAERVTKEINKLRTALTVDLGQSVLKATADLSDWAGGADDIIRVAKAAGPALLGMGAGFLTLRGSIMAARMEAAGLSRALGLLALVPVAYGAGKSIGGWLDSKIYDASAEGLRQLETANAKALEEFKRQQSEKRDAASKVDDARVQSALRVVQELNRAYLADTANAKRSSDAVVKSAEAGLNRLLHTREQLVAQLERAAAESADVITSSNQRISDLTAKGQDREFSLRLRPMDDPQRAMALAQRAQDLASRAASELTKAADKETTSRALSLFGRAEKAGEEARAIAERVGERGLEVRAARALEDVTQRQIRAEKALQAAQAARLPAIERERQRQQAVVDTMRAAVKTVLDNSKLFDAQGALLPADQLAKQAGARQAAMAEIARTALSSKDLTAMGALGVADFVNRFSAELQREPFRLQLTIDTEIARIQSQLRDAFAQFQVSFGVENVRALEAVTGKQFQTPDEVARGLTEAKAKAAELRAAIDAAMTPEGDKLRTEISKILSDVAARAPKRATFGGDYSEGLRAQFAAAMNEFERVRNLSKITQADLESVFTKFKGLREVSQQNLVGRLGFSDDLVRMQEAFNKLQTLQGLQGKGVDPAAVQQLQSLERVIQGIGPDVSAGVQPSASIAGNLWSAAEATAVIQSNLSGASVPTGAALGRAAGGPTGTDTIPAMLSPGEFVVNRRSTAQFASQLVAMNAGVWPIFRSEGGPTTSVGDVSFGDINIGGGRSADTMARQLMSAIKRELRRGTGTL